MPLFNPHNADTTLRHPERKLLPAGGIALQLYKDTCIGLLDILDVEEGEIELLVNAECYRSVDSNFMKEAPVSSYWVEDRVESIDLKLKVFSFPPFPHPLSLSERLANWHGF